MNIFFATFFVCEMVLKWMGLGALNYFQSGWNWIDFFVVIISITGQLVLHPSSSHLVLDVVINASNNDGLRALRALRCLRPLRLIVRAPSLKAVVDVLVVSIPGVFGASVVLGFSWLIFAVLGLHLFGGKFSKCVDEKMNIYSADVVPDRATCLNTTGNVWWTPPASFDNAGLGMISLFQVGVLIVAYQFSHLSLAGQL
jgi:hypothetical protein